MMQPDDPNESSSPGVPSNSAEKRLEQDLRVAELVHRSMIPRDQRRGNLEIVCDFRPSIGGGGDYASVHFQDEEHVVVGICDVSGHGVASALLANRVNSFVLHQAPQVHHPCQLVEALNDFVFHTFHGTGLYLTFFSLFIDLGRQTVVGAGYAGTLRCCMSPSTQRTSADWTLTTLRSGCSRTCLKLARC